MEGQNTNHVIKLVERKNIIISGIKKIINFDEKEFMIDSVMGVIDVKGNNLELIKLDTIDGNVSIKGTINSIDYFDNKKNNETFLTKLFKWINYYI